MPARSAKSSTSGAPARGGKRTNREADVMQAAIEIFWQKGYRVASIQDVADRVGVLKGSLYYYIETKEDLLWRIIEDVHEQWSEILERASAPDETPLERMHAFIKMHVEWYLKNVREVSVFFREWNQLSGDRLRTVKNRRRRYVQAITGLIEAAQEAGEVSPLLDRQVAARYVLAAVNAVPDWYRPASAGPAAKVAEAYADMTVGLLSGTPKPAELPLRKTA